MWIIYGTRHYGAVDRHENEYAVTRVAHIYYLPLIPLGCTWVTRSDGSHIHGYRIKLHPRSIAAAFLRPWGLLVGGLGLGSAIMNGAGASAIAIGAASAALLAITIRSFLRKDVRGERALRERQFARAALGVGCDPAYLPAETAAALRTGIEDAWAKQSAGRTPGDVARLGARSPGEAVLAWGVLRRGALTMPREQRREAERDAARIIDGTRALPIGSGSPYRDPARDLEPVDA
jgi:hypothetical protein